MFSHIVTHFLSDAGVYKYYYKLSPFDVLTTRSAIIYFLDYQKSNRIFKLQQTPVLCRNISHLHELTGSFLVN